jgi:hypothetical protein
MEKINFILNLAIIVFLLYKHLLYRFRIGFNTTFWKKRPIGIYFMWYNKEKTYGKGFFHFNWIPYNVSEKIDEKDWQKKKNITTA